MDRILLATPARIHLGLIDMNGEIGRVDGGVGIALEDPHTLIEARPADHVFVECESEPEIVPRLEEALRCVCKEYGYRGAHLNVRARPLPHVGLGSATQTMLGAAHAVCRLYGDAHTSNDLAVLSGRGGTSGIGAEAIQTGGFIVDGGHRFRRGKTCEDCKDEYTPSRSSRGIHPPPILTRMDFPEWDILIAVPLGYGASGLREITLFKVVCPVPIDQVRQMCHIILMEMMPAILEKDLETFGRAVEDFQLLGFKVFELRAQTQLVKDCMQFLKNNGGVGVGMSSWGPATFCFGEDLSALRLEADQWLAAHGGGKTILTKANNVGLRVIDKDEQHGLAASIEDLWTG